ncbi:MAG: hypothetical protein HUJ25_10945 [Crocinitomicaceae bacterium]|nr:hypothetical protein [Crocinitomicaceae bacterium]
MQDHNSFSDEEFLKLFESCSLRPEYFTHEAHLRLAWLCLKRYDLDKAEKFVVQQLKVYTSHWGASDKYHHTITIAAVKAVHHFYLRSKSTNFCDFIVEYPRLKTHFKALMAQHYRAETLHAEKAKTEFIQPDRLSF